MALTILLAGKNRDASFTEEDVVKKSFPGFWEEIQKAGLRFRN
jgi:5-enolpyruvylshikimate-3-phosphate synthase